MGVTTSLHYNDHDVTDTCHATFHKPLATLGKLFTPTVCASVTKPYNLVLLYMLAIKQAHHVMH